jgi:hypothetical protein
MDNPFSMLDARTQTSADEQYATRIQEFFNAGEGDTLAKLKNFTKFVRGRHWPRSWPRTRSSSKSWTFTAISSSVVSSWAAA